MVRPNRGDDWVPLTIRLHPDAARRLRVAAARRRITQGRLLDEILLAHLQPADLMPAPTLRPPQGEVHPLTAQGLKRKMTQLGITQAELATALEINQKSVSEWGKRNTIPQQQHEAIRRFLADRRAGKKATTKSK